MGNDDVKADVLREQVTALEEQLKIAHDYNLARDALERRIFIRHAAVSIYTAGMASPPQGSFNVGRAPTVTFSPRTCWEAAKALWDAKPEDC